MLKLKLNKELAGHQDGSMLKKSVKGGMNYPMFYRMATGKWNTRALDTLAQFLSANGYTAEALQDAKFTDIFTVENVKADCVFILDQRVKTESGEGTVKGFIREEGRIRVIVLHDEDNTPPPPHKEYSLYQYKEDELKPVNEAK